VLGCVCGLSQSPEIDFALKLIFVQDQHYLSVRTIGYSVFDIDLSV
jgi:hypothetical protein